MQIVNLDHTKYLSVLAYGKPGSGKTHLLGTACDDDRSYPVLHVDVSGNPETLANRRDSTNPKKLGRIPYVVRLQKLSELNAIFDWFEKGQPDDHPMVDKMGCTPGYKTLIFDGVTAIQRQSFNVVLGQELKPGDVPIKPVWATYAAVLRQMLVVASCFLQQLRNRNIHVLVSCLEHTDMRYTSPGIADTAYQYAEPGLQGQAVTELPGEALAVLRLCNRAAAQSDVTKASEMRNAYTIAQLRENKYAYAKDQHHLGGISIGDSIYMGDPTVPKLLDAIGAQV